MISGVVLVRELAAVESLASAAECDHLDDRRIDQALKMPCPGFEGMAFFRPEAVSVVDPGVQGASGGR
jgi:hypothetical protein